jgi:DNA-binding MarR family transcriptional regulator
MKTIFNPHFQNASLDGKIIIALERISEVFKVLLWEKGKALNLSPLQVQLLIFIETHKSNLAKVSYLANEFNVTKATISDAIKALEKKELVTKVTEAQDARSYQVHLTNKGKSVVKQLLSYTSSLEDSVQSINSNEKETLYTTLLQLIKQLYKTQIISLQRTCYACKFLKNTNGNHYCTFLNTPLTAKEIRIDCPEFEAQ